MNLNFIDKIEKSLVEHLKSENEHVHYISLIYAIISKINKDDKSFPIHEKIIKSIELLKASTLIIDDIIDNSYKRNNDKSFVYKFGINNSILIGEQLKSHSTIDFIENINKLPVSSSNKINSILVFEDSFLTVSKGQLYDINLLTFNKEMFLWDKEKWEKYMSIYFDVIYKTTSVFLQIPFLVLYHLGFVKKDEFDFYHNYFQHMGIAYQVRDDIIDAVGLEEDIGREQGSDINERKIRLPLINFFMNCKKNELKSYVFENLSKEGDIPAKDMNKIIDILYKTNSIKKSIETLNSICDNAIRELENISDIEHKEELIDLVTFLKL